VAGESPVISASGDLVLIANDNVSLVNILVIVVVVVIFTRSTEDGCISLSALRNEVIVQLVS
jgi:hypothetical protein